MIHRLEQLSFRAMGTACSATVTMAARVIDVYKDYVLKGGITVRALRGVSIEGTAEVVEGTEA